MIYLLLPNMQLAVNTVALPNLQSLLPTINVRAQLLILKGVHSLELTQEPVKEAIYEATSFYSKIPKRFTSVANWPKTTNLKCWICDLIPTSYPRFLPMNPEVINGNDECDTHGNYCDWSCVVRYVEEKYPREQWPDFKASILKFESKFSGKRKLLILPSLDKTKRKEYCGDSGMSQKDWRKKMEDELSNYDLSHHKMEQFAVSCSFMTKPI